MNDQTVKVLIEVNNQFYKNNAESFSKTRVQPWDGWKVGIEILSPLLAKDLTVIDFAAGNLRFEKFLLGDFGSSRLKELHTIDNCDALLPTDLSTYQNLITFQKCDILETLLKKPLHPVATSVESDLTVCFGFMHHIPALQNRLKFLNAIIDATQIDGYVFLSFWCFVSDAKSQRKSQETTSAFLKTHQELIFANDLEKEDYFLGWQNLPNEYRYCHNFTNEEIDHILAEFSDRIQIVARYNADGKNNSQNCYVIFKKVK